MGVIGSRVRQSRHAIVAVAQDFDPQAMIVAGQLIEAAKELVEQADQLLGGALRCQDGETDDVGEPGTAQRK